MRRRSGIHEGRDGEHPRSNLDLPAQVRVDRIERVAPGALGLLARLRHDLLHGANRHLAVAAIGVVECLLELIADAGDLDPIHDVEGAIEMGRIVALHFLHLAIAQRQIQILAAGGICHTARVGRDDPPPLGILHIVNRHIAQGIRGGVDAGGSQKELPGDDLVDHLFLQLKGRLFALDVDDERAQPVV